MRPFNRERFLFLLLSAVMGINALFFAYGLFACSRSKQPHLVCPNLGERFDSYSEKALAAVLGLIAGAGAFSITQRASSEAGPDGPSVLPPPQPPSPPSREETPAASKTRQRQRQDQ